MYEKQMTTGVNAAVILQCVGKTQTNDGAHVRDNEGTRQPVQQCV